MFHLLMRNATFNPTRLRTLRSGIIADGSVSEDLKAVDFVTGAPVTCIPIQGGGQPFVGAEPLVYTILINRKVEFKSHIKPAFYYNEVEANFRFITKKLRNGTIKGSMRWQYEFLIPKYPIGTFSIYSCLGEATFTAKPRG